MCGENVDSFNTTWSLTVVNTLVVLPCTGEYTGNASRYCSTDGKWEEPSYIHCTSISIQNLKEQVNLVFTMTTLFYIISPPPQSNTPYRHQVQFISH